MQQRVAADQLDLVEEQQPAGEAGGAEEPGEETQPLAGQVARRHRAERVEPAGADRLERPAQLGDPDRVTGPEPQDRFDGLVAAGHLAAA